MRRRGINYWVVTIVEEGEDGAGRAYAGLGWDPWGPSTRWLPRTQVMPTLPDQA